jgi:TolA-binding protein
MMLWDQWKKGFDAWENRTATMMESVLKSESVLMPMGAMLTATMKAKAATDKAVAEAWERVGLPTRRDQERTLHALNQIQSRLIDLEEKLASMEKSRN